MEIICQDAKENLQKAGYKKRKEISRNFISDYNKYVSNSDVKKKIEIGRKWANRFDFDYDASLRSTHIFCVTTFADCDTKIDRQCSKYKYEIKMDKKVFRGDTMNTWKTTVDRFSKLYGESLKCIAI